MSEWTKNLEALLLKKEIVPRGNWKTREDLRIYFKSSKECMDRFLKWGIANKKIKTYVGANLSTVNVLHRKIFYGINGKKTWQQIFAIYSKSREVKPKGKGWKNFQELVRHFKMGEAGARKAINILRKNRKLETFKGCIQTHNSHTLRICFYRIKA